MRYLIDCHDLSTSPHRKMGKAPVRGSTLVFGLIGCNLHMCRGEFIDYSLLCSSYAELLTFEGQPVTKADSIPQYYHFVEVSPQN
jgi:hypothetical protein